MNENSEWIVVNHCYDLCNPRFFIAIISEAGLTPEDGREILRNFKNVSETKSLSFLYSEGHIELSEYNGYFNVFVESLTQDVEIRYSFEKDDVQAFWR